MKTKQRGFISDLKTFGLLLLPFVLFSAVLYAVVTHVVST